MILHYENMRIGRAISPITEFQDHRVPQMHCESPGAHVVAYPGLQQNAALGKKPLSQNKLGGFIQDCTADCGKIGARTDPVGLFLPVYFSNTIQKK